MRYLRLRVGIARWWNSTRIRSGADESRSNGRVWTAGPQVVIRYYAAHPVDGDRVPICAVARLGNGQMRKLPGSKPGTAILEGSIAAAFIVDAFR
jgi:hypothetical protein